LDSLLFSRVQSTVWLPVSPGLQGKATRGHSPAQSPQPTACDHGP
jgi:hypothetical protein